MLHCRSPSSVMRHEAADVPERRSSSAVWTKRLKVLDTVASRPLFLPSAPISFSMLLTSNVASPGHDATADTCSQPSEQPAHDRPSHSRPDLSMAIFSLRYIWTFSLQAPPRGLHVAHPARLYH